MIWTPQRSAFFRDLYVVMDEEEGDLRNFDHSF